MKKKDIHWGQAGIVAVACAAFFAFLIPLQTYLANRELFAFSPAEMLLEASPWFLVSAAGLFVVLVASERFSGRFLHLAVLAVLVCGYLEVGILSIGLPPFNAAIRVFQNPFRIIIDSAILGLVIVSILASYRWIKSLAHWMALAILILSISSLFDVAPKPTAAGGVLADGQCPNYDVLMSARLSPSRNVLVLILDSTPASITSELMRNDAVLREKFSGFIAFENNRAMHEMSSRGVPGLLTGKYLEKDTPAHVYEASALGPDSILYSYAERGLPTYWTSGIGGDGFTNRRLGNFSKTGENLNASGSVFLRNSRETPYVTLLDTVRFRLAPYRYKAGILAKAVGRAMRGCVWKNHSDEELAYQALMSAPLSAETNSALVVLHTSGTHGPIKRDRKGNLLPAPTHEPAAFAEYAPFLFRRVATLMDDLRKKGIYDKTMIVICADHGSIELRRGDGTKGHGADDSILWVKPFDARSPFQISSVPTSNCRIADLVRSSRDRNLTAAEISTVLHASERKFRAKFGRAWWSSGRSPYFYEWRYDDAGRVISCANLGVFKAN